jgi:hypothetical protein
MPENNESAKFTINANSLDSTIVALAKVGNGSGRAIADGSGELPIYSRSSRLFHEVGRSKATCEHQSTDNSEVLLAEHSLQVWGPQRTDC